MTKKKGRRQRSVWEDGGRFEVFIRGRHSGFLTKAASRVNDNDDDGDENYQSEFAVVRLRGSPLPPGLMEGDTFTTRDGESYRILELYWGYKGWVSRKVLGSSLLTQSRSVAENCAFAVCCNACTSSIYT